MSKILRVIAAGALLTIAHLAHAAPIAGWTTADTHAYGQTVSFDSAGQLAENTLITDQFQAQGVRFTGMLQANSCGYGFWDGFGMPGNSVGTFGPDCSSNTVADAFAIKFDGAVSKLALDAYLFDDQYLASFDLYLGGALVSSLPALAIGYDELAEDTVVNIDGRFFTKRPQNRAGILQIEGALFDEIRFSENVAGGNGYLFFDNLRFDAAPRAVPEPASLGLLGLGLAAIGALRRKRGAARQA